MKPPTKEQEEQKLKELRFLKNLYNSQSREEWYKELKRQLKNLRRTDTDA